jgi:thioredoxin 1
MENTGSGKVEIILFYTTDCPACKAYMPRFDNAILQLGQSVTVNKIDINKDSSLNNQYNLTAVPTTIAVKNGQVVERHVGEITTRMVRALANL